jgi:hypothetical protein
VTTGGTATAGTRSHERGQLLLVLLAALVLRVAYVAAIAAMTRSVLLAFPVLLALHLEHLHPRLDAIQKRINIAGVHHDVMTQVAMVRPIRWDSLRHPL